MELWSMGTWLAIALCGVAGVTLGLVGGGGSILTTPILVFAAGLAPTTAVALSLPVVGATSLVGAVIQARAGRVHYRAAAILSAAGMVGAPLGALGTHRVPQPVLMGLFGLLMAVVGIRMALGGEVKSPDDGGTCRPVVCAAAGLGIGVLTGFLGVGGGFLIVPVLLRFARTPMSLAVGTSLLIIAINSAVGTLGHLSELRGHTDLAVALTAATIAGLAAGMRLGTRLQPRQARLAFAGVAVTVAAWVLVSQVTPILKML